MSRSGVAIVLLLALAAPARGERVLLMPASGAGISAAIIEAARARFRARLAEREPALSVIDAEGPTVATPVTMLAALGAARQAQADLVVTFDLRRSEGTTVMAVIGQPLFGQAALFAFTGATVYGPETIAELVERAVSLAVAARAERGPAPRPRPSLGVGLQAGLQAPFNTPGPISSVLPGAGLLVIKYFTYAFADLRLSYAGVDTAHALSFGMGGYAPLVQADDTVYLGAALRWQGNQLGGQGASGFAIAPTVGAAWRRPLGLSFRLEADLRYDLFRESEPDRLVPGSDRPHRGAGVELWMGAWL